MSALGRYGALMLGALAIAACQEKNDGSPPAVSAAPAAAAPARVTDDQISTPADFEEEAAKEISDDNAEQELSKLEQEVSTE